MNTPETIKNLKKGKNSKTIHQIEIESGEIVNTFDGASEGENKTNIVPRPTYTTALRVHIFLIIPR